MSDARIKVLTAIEALGKRYIREILAEKDYDKQILRADWYFAFKFFIRFLYFQGRNDSLSERYFLKMEACLDQFFQPDPTEKLKALWRNDHLPHATEWWKDFQVEHSPLWQKFDNSMGKRRDREMVFDVLRYVYQLENHNVVNKSISEIKAGRIEKLRNELMYLRGVGPKTSAFYLRDLVFLFEFQLTNAEAREIQPVDTWVIQVVNKICGDSKDLNQISPEDWLVQVGGNAFNSALLNAGAWYLGKFSFELVIKLLAVGNVSSETLEQMELGKLDG